MHRAYHALPPLTTKEGVPVNAVYGFAVMLQKLVREQAPDYLAVVMDKYSRRVLGWAYGKRKDVALTLKALNRAVHARRPPRGLIFHTDRGIEYAADAFKARLAELGVTQSYTTSSIFLDGQLVITTTESGQSVAPICLRPGAHALAIVADVLDGAPTTLQLWWRPPRAAGDLIPCHALTPASWSTGEPGGQGGAPF